MTFVPIPPSKARGDPLYDPRLTRILELAFQGWSVDIRDMLFTSASIEAAHESGARPSIEDLQDLLEVDRKLVFPDRRTIAVFDDVLTTGAHYLAAKATLAECMPQCAFFGMFLARVRRPSAAEEFADLT